MRKTIGFLALTAFCLMFAGCSTFFTQASSFPSAATLESDCATGKAATPPVRDNACDLYNAVQQFCIGQTALPVNAVQACALAGYAISGTFTPL